MSIVEGADKPSDILEYRDWLADALGVEVTSAVENHYKSVAATVLQQAQASDWWATLTHSLPGFNDEYHIQEGYPLIVPGIPPTLESKPFESFFIKTFRRNVLANARWNSPPDGGWILPNTWFTQINDIVRGRLLVKYLDGVTFLATKLEALATAAGLPFRATFEAKEEGYYAAHLYITPTFDVPGFKWDSQALPISVELQVATQLQDVIWRLTHSYYEQRRTSVAPPDIKWQWDPSCQEFVPNYLGHILHYVEGMIMEVRRRPGPQA
jgi:hypothetical protein